jgi:hypothetical protein
MPSPDMPMIHKRNFIQELGKPTSPEEHIARKVFLAKQFEALKAGGNYTNILRAIQADRGNTDEVIGTHKLRRKLKAKGYGVPLDVKRFIDGKATRALQKLLDAFEEYLASLPEPDPLPDPYGDVKYDDSGQGLIPFGEALTKIFGV